MKKGSRKKKTGKPSPSKAKKERMPEPLRIDWGAVPKLVTDPKLIAPPALPMRHDHPYVPAQEIRHPEVRLVIKTRYMEQKPSVLAIESSILSTIITLFMALLLFMLHINLAVFVPVLVAIWLLFVILLYKFFEE